MKCNHLASNKQYNLSYVKCSFKKLPDLVGLYLTAKEHLNNC